MRNRNKLRLTGQPGWLRLGYSPGWVGRSASGVGPCAEYLLTGAWPCGMQIPAQFSAPLAAPAPAAGLTAQITTLQQSIQTWPARRWISARQHRGGGGPRRTQEM